MHKSSTMKVLNGMQNLYDSTKQPLTTSGKANIYETLKLNVMKYTGINEMNTEEFTLSKTHFSK